MSAFIPDQLDEMSKTELLEFAQTAHEENVKLKAEKKEDLLTTVADYVLEVLRSESIENFSTNALSTNEGRRVELTIRYVDGDTPADKLEQQQSEIWQLTEQLSKANERVRELECDSRHVAVAIREIIARGDIKPLMVGGNAIDEVVNKFALEQKIEILEELLGRTCPVSGPVVPDKQSRDTLQDHIEQLRKEQDDV